MLISKVNGGYQDQIKQPENAVKIWKNFFTQNSKIFTIKLYYKIKDIIKNGPKPVEITVTLWEWYFCSKEWCNWTNKFKEVAKDSWGDLALQISWKSSRCFRGCSEPSWVLSHSLTACYSLSTTFSTKNWDKHHVS